MPTIVKLSLEQVKEQQDKGKSQRQLIAEQYDAMLQDFDIGEWGDVVLDATDTRNTVRNRLKAAADRRGVALNFRRMQGNRMRFQVVTPGEQGTDDEEKQADLLTVQESGLEEPGPIGTDGATPRRRGGRRKKTVIPGTGE